MINHQLGVQSSLPYSLPNDDILGGRIFCLPGSGLTAGLGCIEWSRNTKDNVRRAQLRIKPSLDRNAVLYLGGANLVDCRMYSKRQMYVGSRSIPMSSSARAMRKMIYLLHQFELSIRRNEADGSIRTKRSQLHTLMELTIVQSYSIICRLFRLVQNKLIVQTKLAFRHSGQIRSHQDLAINIRSENGTLGAHQKVDVLDYVYEGFILFVFDIVASPADSTSHLSRQLGALSNLACVKIMPKRYVRVTHVGHFRAGSFCRNVGFESINFARLWVPKVENF
jgi:hypothetical protein